MSLENDARRSLLAAVEDVLHVELAAADLNVAKPSDKDFKCNFVKWRKVLEAACSLLRDEGHAPRAPTNAEAAKLLDKAMSSSLGYLVKLATRQRGLRLGPVALTAAAATIAVTAAMATLAYRNRLQGRRP